MLFTGSFRRAIDEKQRIAVPKRVRSLLEGDNQKALYVAPGTDGSLCMYTEEGFSRMADQLAQAPPTGQEVRAFSRLFYAQTERVELDNQGRIRIPSELAQLAGLTREVVMVGVRDHLELWDAARWDTYLGQQQVQYDTIAERAFGVDQGTC